MCMDELFIPRNAFNVDAMSSCFEDMKYSNVCVAIYNCALRKLILLCS